jgi:hypothetical protein
MGCTQSESLGIAAFANHLDATIEDSTNKGNNRQREQ